VTAAPVQYVTKSCTYLVCYKKRPTGCALLGAASGREKKKMVHPVAEADERRPFGRLTPEEFYARHGVTHSTSTFINPRGLRIFTQRSTPLPAKLHRYFTEEPHPYRDTYLIF
jgi:hypothetical protein